MAIEQPSAAEVRAIITTGATDATIVLVVAHAALMAEACIEDLDAARQKAILTYMAADILAAAISSGGQGAKTSESLGDASVSWASNLAGAEYGKSAYWQRAVMLDPNGCIKRLGMRRATLEKV
jgi:hypothetical protein